jgi:hypothetical protein
MEFLQFLPVQHFHLAFHPRIATRVNHFASITPSFLVLQILVVLALPPSPIIEYPAGGKGAFASSSGSWRYINFPLIS